MKCKHCGTEFDGKYCPMCGKQAQDQNNSGLSSHAGAVNANPKTNILVILLVALIVAVLILAFAILFTHKSAEPAPLVEEQVVSAEQSENDAAEAIAAVSVTNQAQSTELTVNQLMKESGISGSKDTSGEVKCSSEVFGNEKYDRRDIKSIEIVDTLEGAPADAWDVSEDKNGSILAWVDSNRLTIAANGEIQANEDCCGLFAWYSDASEIRLNGNLNTKNTKDMSMMFYHCDNLDSIDLTGVKTKKVTTMERMFAHCESLARLDLGGFNTAKVTDMSRMFYHCKSLVSLDVSSFNTKKVKHMERMFESCESIPKLDVSSFDTSKVKSGKSMFFRCYALKTIELSRSRFDTGSMTTMYGMFGACYSLKSVDVSGFKTGKVTDMSYMFNGDSELKDLDISGFDMKKVEKKKKMIAGTKLEEKQKEEEKKRKEEEQKKAEEKAKKKNKYVGTFYDGDDRLSISKDGSLYDVYVHFRGWESLSLYGDVDGGALWVEGFEDTDSGEYVSAVITVEGKKATFTVIESNTSSLYEGETYYFYLK